MKSALSGAAVWIAALWWGSLTTVGFYVVPMLFAYLPTPALAGNMAGQLFSAQTWVAVVCGLLLLLDSRPNEPPAQSRQALPAIFYVVGGMFLALLSEFVVAPHIIARDNLRLWHSLGTGMYALQWVCAAMAFRRLLSGKPAQ